MFSTLTIGTRGINTTTTNALSLRSGKIKSLLEEIRYHSLVVWCGTFLLIFRAW